MFLTFLVGFETVVRFAMFLLVKKPPTFALVFGKLLSTFVSAFLMNFNLNLEPLVGEVPHAG